VERTTPQPTFYLTTAIDYANGPPHLGHALEKIQADCIARYQRLRGVPVHFVTGLDEHGETVAQTARTAGATPRAWVDAVAVKYGETVRALSISCDDFIRTTEPRHAQAVREVLRRIRLHHPDDIYEAASTGSYCCGCEAFKLPGELVDGRCAEHPTMEVEWVEERCHFFRLSAYADRLRRHYEAHPDFVVPPSSFDKIRWPVEGGLPDFVISRGRRQWGIPFPGAREHTVHVWFDALVNYLSVAGFPEQRYERLWPADLQIVGPDITRFHAVVWPAMLMAANLELPRQVWTHGWLKTNGARLSKTGGVRVTLEEAIERHGPDALRYYLLSAMPWEGDGEFSWRRFDSLYATGLAGNLGSLASRTVAMLVRHCGGRVPPPADAEGELDRSHGRVLERYRRAMEALRVKEGARQLARLGSVAGQYADERGGGVVKPTNRELEETLAALHRGLVRVAALAQPFMPGKAQELYRMLGGPGSVAALRWEELPHPPTAGWQVVSGAPLFPVRPRRDRERSSR
jgi:methionyl-tRNA synthetase